MKFFYRKIKSKSRTELKLFVFKINIIFIKSLFQKVQLCKNIDEKQERNKFPRFDY